MGWLVLSIIVTYGMRGPPDFSFGARRFRRRDGGERTQALGLPFFTLCRKKGGAAGGWRFSLSHPMQKAERTPLRCLSAVLRAREGGAFTLCGGMTAAIGRSCKGD